MATTQIARAHNLGTKVVEGATIVFTSPAAAALSGTILYNKRAIKLVHNAEVQRITDEDGDIVGLSAGGEFLEMTCTFTPYGTNATNSLVSHSMPVILSKAVISGASIFPMGSFSDALNDASGGLWIYEGGGELNFDAGIGPSSMTLTLRRYAAITDNAAV